MLTRKFEVTLTLENEEDYAGQNMEDISDSILELTIKAALCSVFKDTDAKFEAKMIK